MTGYVIDRFVSIIGIIVVVILYLKMDAYTEEARVLPGALLIIAGILFLIMAFQSFVLKSYTKEVFANLPVFKISLVVVTLFMYFFLIQKLGFYVSSWLFFMVITTWFNKDKSKVFSLVVGTLFILLLYFIFGMLLKVPLPRGAFI
ncbi:tripartite tricarboxylate transporter TctB family protein [Natranaerofaba carboxydovora]|uniref:tripartite tricarboxylate transporter TctB family protein n=1 Tax=Natranaerofaba carboxydovora TaxID=2742683 RepID=UPI001F12DDF1|nr:tripartite tricarboxylate transporter TctB family protein [Natranaerofaba carboxydovora]UMZ72819.1 Tripartite tricarboxylate transporter TctB family protein [Natranaerofaba carboxydovora]